MQRTLVRGVCDQRSTTRIRLKAELERRPSVTCCSDGKPGRVYRNRALNGRLWKRDLFLRKKERERRRGKSWIARSHERKAWLCKRDNLSKERFRRFSRFSFSPFRTNIFILLLFLFLSLSPFFLSSSSSSFRIAARPADLQSPPRS